ncbi:MAG: biotin transporter BioY [Actinobacteria bacterium]|nr:biotin transporter BioY [Actinomycetota bacterium]
MNLNNLASESSPITASSKKIFENIILKLTFSLIFAILMGISANTFLYLPFTPIPVTMQVLTVLISPFFLGRRWAMASQAEYIILGLSGLPVFSGFHSGIAALTGPTGGYIIGFLFASFITGYIFESFALKRLPAPKINDENLIKYDLNKNDKTVIMFISCIAGLALIYTCGFIQLLGYLMHISGSSFSVNLLIKTLNLGISPFVLIDLLKILIILNINKISEIKTL